MSITMIDATIVIAHVMSRYADKIYIDLYSSQKELINQLIIVCYEQDEDECAKTLENFLKNF